MRRSTRASSSRAIDESGFDARAARLLDRPRQLRGVSRRAARFRQEESFPIGLKLLSGAIRPAEAGRDYSALAASIVETALAFVERDFAAEHGRVPGGRCDRPRPRQARLARDDGGLRSRSHPDLRFRPRAAGVGRRRARCTPCNIIPASRSGSISALTVATRRGALYQVDMRLRPSGKQGPLATQLRSFVEYQNGAAETWEHMAL